MNAEDTPMPSRTLKDLEGPAFDKPWQVQAFSLVVNMHKSGLFKWREWAEMFTEEVHASPARPEESVNDAYYRQWATTLERMMVTLGLVTRDDVLARSNEWRNAYLNTPHAHPIELENATCPPVAQHHSHHQHEPRRSPVLIVAANS